MNSARIADIIVHRLPGTLPPRNPVKFVSEVGYTPKCPLNGRITGSKNLFYDTYLVEILTEDGTSGFAPGKVGESAKTIIDNAFKELLIGQSPLDTEKLWDHLYRVCLPYGRHGPAIHALGAVDTALWDLKGKLLEEPVYRLLGGSTRQKLDIYGTTNNAAVCARHGFTGVKVVMTKGPSDGAEGFERNLEIVRQARENLTAGMDLMIECDARYNSWDLAYALRFAEAVKPLNPLWLEDALHPDNLRSYQELKKHAYPIKIAVGNLEQTRSGFMRLLEKGIPDILQPCPIFSGGITEVIKIAHLAAAFEVPVFYHGFLGTYGYHMTMADMNASRAEFMFFDEEDPTVLPSFVKSGPVPQNGTVVLGEQPGFGIEFDKASYQANHYGRPEDL